MPLMTKPSTCPLIFAMATVVFGLISGCGDSSPSPGAAAPPPGAPVAEHNPRPNVLFIVWDTVRADYLSLHGYDKRTTPFLEKWSGQARVFDNCVSIASTTVPTHVSMFTGFAPLEHGAHNLSPLIADELHTLAEILGESGYDTYLYSENPKISARNNITQGFDLVEHPWSDSYQDEALRIALGKVPPHDRSTGLAQSLRQPNAGKLSALSAGELAQKGALKWVKSRESDKPYFIFLNYLAAHYPLIPPREFREEIMTPAQVEASYLVDRTVRPFRLYVFGQHEYSPADLELTRLTYAAAVRELDSLLEDLLAALRNEGYLENTIVVLTSDHGEHLGEQHLLGHQYSVYEPLANVPLVLYYPARITPRRDDRPVSNLDIFPTLLEIAGIDKPVGDTGVSLLEPLADRRRICTYTGVVTRRFDAVRRRVPGFDPAPWNRTLCAYYAEPYKFIRGSDGRHELYRLDVDPLEKHNLIDLETGVARRLREESRQYLDTLKPLATPDAPAAPVDEEHQKRLRAIGYLDESDAQEFHPPADTRPSDKRP